MIFQGSFLCEALKARVTRVTAYFRRLDLGKQGTLILGVVEVGIWQNIKEAVPNLNCNQV